MRKLRYEGLRSLSTAAALATALSATAWAHHSRGNFDLENVKPALGDQPSTQAAIGSAIRQSPRCADAAVPSVLAISRQARGSGRSGVGGAHVDLGSESWKAIRVGPTGWELSNGPPVKFRRSPGMLPLPIPAVGGDIEMLREFVNVGDDDDFRLLIAFILAALRPSGPYPILVSLGE